MNLMSSIGNFFNGEMLYPELRIFPNDKIKGVKNVVLLVVDGLGYEYLKNKKSILNENLAGEMTSVFLPTTACAVTSFLTGVAPQQHGLTGWFMNLKEAGVVSAVLPFVPRYGGEVLSDYDIDMKNIINCESFFKKIKASKFLIQEEKIAYSDYSRIMADKAKVGSFKNLSGFFSKIKKAIKYNNKKKYIYAYWSEFDHICHDYGIGSKKCEKHFKELDKGLRKFIKQIKGTNSALIITADHGFMNIAETISIEDYPEIKECLDLPLCGDARTVYCYVNYQKRELFEKLVREKLGNYCDIYKSSELIENNYFGLFEANEKLIHRVGDYTLICKEKYSLRDSIDGKVKLHKGDHGGVSREEMIVPLVFIRV